MMILKASRSQPAPTYKHLLEDPLACSEIIGPAKAGYKPSLALINSNTGIDYYLMPADSSKEPLAVVLPDMMIKTLFRTSRAAAMESGDRDAVTTSEAEPLLENGGFCSAE